MEDTLKWLHHCVEFSEDQCPDFGIRSLKMSSDGRMMASGDRSGNLRVHDMSSWELLTYQEAHDSEILSIDLTTPKKKGKLGSYMFITTH